MPSIIKENLRFFDKTGSDISPILVDGVWTGLLRIPDASIGLHEVAHIFIAEDVINTSKIITRTANTLSGSPIITFTNGTTKGVKPNMWIQGANIPNDTFVNTIKNPTQIFITNEATATGSTNIEMHSKKYEITYPRSNQSKIRARLESNVDTPFFLFDVEFEETMPTIVKLSECNFILEDGSSDTLIFNHRNLNNSEINKKVLQINLASVAKNEGAYYNNVIIEEVDSDNTITQIAKFQIEFEAEGEDSRFKSMLENFGATIDSNDYIAFRNTDIKEEKIDFKEMNLKRKEMLLTGSDIWPYLGSYKGLINALKYFGYGDLRLKEYWLNVSESSKNEGKYVTMNVPLSLQYSDTEFKYYKQFIDGIFPNQPSKTFSKTSKFALFYDLNRDSGEYDEDGLPITEDVFEFTNEEILIKLFSLKNILKEKFLPLNARIVDITGEGVYYDNIGINSWNIPTPTIHVNVESELDFVANPITGYLSDKTNLIAPSHDIKVSTKLKDKETINLIDYAYFVVGDDVDTDGLEIVPPHPRYSKKVGLSVTLTNVTNDYTWDELSTSWDDASDRNWDDLKYRDFQTIRWIVKSISKNEIVFDKKAKVGELDVVEILLPYIGYYDVTLELIDHFNYPHRQTKKNYIQVRPREADMVAVFRKHDGYDTWEDIEGSEDDLPIADMHGTWMDPTINEKTTWTEAGDITWEALDWSTYANQNNLFDYLNDANSSVPNLLSDSVGRVIGLTPENHKVKVNGLNNALLQRNKKYNALFLKDRNKANTTVLKISGNESGPTISSRQFTNNSVFFINKDIGWIVGNNGKFIYTINGGNTWEIEPINSSDNLNSVYFTDASNGWIVGDFGTVFHYSISGTSVKTITKVNVNTNKKLNRVYFIDSSIGFIAGDGIILKTTDGGISWSNITPPSLTDDVTSINFPNVALGIAVTDKGKILRTVDAGFSWTIDDRNPYSFRDVDFYDSNFGWIASFDTSVQFNNKVLRTIDGGLTWDEYNSPIEMYSISFYNSMIGFASGKFNTTFKTLNGGMNWLPNYYETPFIQLGNQALKSIYTVDSLTVYSVGTNGYILKTSNGGIILGGGVNQAPPPSNWVSQKANQLNYTSGSNTDVWVTEPYSGTILKNERGTIGIRHNSNTLTWTGVNTLTTTWSLGSLQYALNATEIYFDTPNGRKQYSIQSAKLTITNEIEYVLHQYIYDTTDLTISYVFQSYASIYIDSTPVPFSGGLKLTWKDIWTNERVDVFNNMYILLKLESKDFYCDVLDYVIEDDNTTLTLDWNCDVVKKLDSDYTVVLKDYDIERANTKLGSINRTWETFCDDILWQDMSDKTWNDFEFNGISYCGFTINKVERGGTIVVDNEHFFQFPPEKLLQIEGNLINGDSYIDLDGLIAIKNSIIGNTPINFIETETYWVLSDIGDGTNLANGYATKLTYTGSTYGDNYSVFRVLGKYFTTGLGNGIVNDDFVTMGIIFSGDAVITTNVKKKSFTKSCDITNSSGIKLCDIVIDSQTISTLSTSNLIVGMIVNGTGIPTNSKIISITSSTTFDINNIATTTAVDEALTFDYDTTITSDLTGDLEIGMTVTGNGIPNGSKITDIVNSTSFKIDNVATATGVTVSLTFESFNTSAPSVELSNQNNVIGLLYPNMQDLEIGMSVHGDGIPMGSSIIDIEGVTPFNPNRILISNSATKTGTSLLSLSTASITLDEAIEYLNNSDVVGIRDFYYSKPLLEDGITYADYISAKAKFPGVGALHYFKFLYGVESDWDDNPYETHSYPLGQMKDWTKSEEDGGQPLGENNPPLWNYLYNTYYEFGEWFPSQKELGDYYESIDSMRALYSQALDGNFNWQDTIITKWKAKITPGTTLFLNSFPSKIVGVKSHYWRIYDNTNTLMYDTTNDFLIWTFCEPGTFTIELKITDIAGNSYLVRRDGFIQVVSPEIINHELPGLGWSPPNIPPSAPIPTSVVPPPIIPPPIEMVVPPLIALPSDVTIGNTPIPEPNIVVPSTYQNPVIPADPVLRYNANFWIVYGNNTDQLQHLVYADWSNAQIQNLAFDSLEFYLEYVNDNTGEIETIKYDIEARYFITSTTQSPERGLEIFSTRGKSIFPSKWLLPMLDDDLIIKLVTSSSKPTSKLYIVPRSTSNM